MASDARALTPNESLSAREAALRQIATLDRPTDPTLPYATRAELRATLDLLAAIDDVDLPRDATMLMAMALKLDRRPEMEALEFAERIASYVTRLFPRLARSVADSRARGKLTGSLAVDAASRAVGSPIQVDSMAGMANRARRARLN